MPNRILKESICTSENIDQLSAFEETFFYRLIVNCDDYGRIDARPKVLAAKLFPLKDIPMKKLESAIMEIVHADLVIPYQVDGKPYLQMKTWDQHQRIRAKKSRCPSPDSNSRTFDSNLLTNDSEMPQSADVCLPESNPIQSNPNTNTNQNTNPNTNTRRFAPPTFDEVKAYCQERGNKVDPQRFMDYYSANGWRVGKNPMRDWRAACRNWERDSGTTPARPAKTVVAQQYDQRDYSTAPDNDWMTVLSILQGDMQAGGGTS